MRTPLRRALATPRFRRLLSAGATSALLVVYGERHLGVADRFGILLMAIAVGQGAGPLVLQRLVREVRRPALLFGGAGVLLLAAGALGFVLVPAGILLPKTRAPRWRCRRVGNVVTTRHRQAAERLDEPGPKQVADRGDRRVARRPRWKGPRSPSTEVVQWESQPVV